MTYRDVAALLTRVEILERQSIRVRARANRIAWARRARRARSVVRKAILLGLLGLPIAFVLYVLTCPSGYTAHARKQQAQTDTVVLRSIVEKYRADRGVGTCPSLERLVADKELSASSKLTDPWDHRYEVNCDPRVVIRSAGPDGIYGNADDILASSPD